MLSDRARSAFARARLVTTAAASADGAGGGAHSVERRWQCGGLDGDLALFDASGARASALFAGQHNVEDAGRGEYYLFDNGCVGGRRRGETRAGRGLRERRGIYKAPSLRERTAARRCRARARSTALSPRRRGIAESESARLTRAARARRANPPPPARGASGTT